MLERSDVLVAAVENTFEFLCSGHNYSSATAHMRGNRRLLGASQDLSPTDVTVAIVFSLSKSRAMRRMTRL
ncbi:hypothetical protein RsS62_20620 [Rhizobium dioscoreae]|nr:hypothetical protein RsS62_20620 [Rhizobium dioscoreae]